MVARILVLILSCIPVGVWALGLGQIELHSALNQPLDAEVKLSGVNLEESESIKVGLGSPADFAQINLARPYWLSNLRFKLVNKGDASYIKVTTHGAVSEPYVSFLMVMEAPDGRLSKQYAVLLDPPVKPKSATVRAASAPNDYANSAPAPRYTRRPALESSAAGDNQYGPVRSGDTLSTIVHKLLPANGSVSSRQMMMGLLDANPDAFIGNNINRLKTGYTLIIPDQFLDRERLSSAMSGGSQERLVVEAPSAEEVPSAARAPTTARPAADQALDQASTKKLDELNEVAASRALEIKALKAQVEQLEKRAGLLDAKLALRDEQITKLTSQAPPLPTPTAVEKPEAHAKVAETPKAAPAKTEPAKVEPAKTEEVITEPTAKTEEVIVEPTAKTEEVVTEPTAKTEKTEEVITEPTAKTEEVITEPTAKTEKAEEVITEPTAKPEEAITEPVAKPEEVVETPPVASTETPAETTTETPVASTEEATPEVPPTTETEAPAESIASIEEVKPDTGMNGIALAAIGIAILLGLGATFWVLKRRSSGALADDAERDSYIPDSTKPGRSSAGSMFTDDTAQEVDTLTGLEDLDAANETAAKPAVTQEAVKRPNFEDTAILSVEDTAIFDGDDTAILDELMPSDEFSGSDSLIPSNDGRDGILAEVDIALAYGNHDQAEELLQGAIADSPQHHEYSAKLLEVYHAAGNADAFAEKAAALHLALAGKGGAMWKKVEQMGRDLCPYNPLFAGSTGMEPTRLADDDEALLDMGLDDDNDATAFDRSAPSSSAKALDLGGIDEDDFDLSELGLDDTDFAADTPDNPFMSNFDATASDHSTITMAAPTGGDDGLTSADFGGLDGDDSELLDLGLDLEFQGAEDSESIDLDFGDEFDDALANSGVVLDDGLGDHTQVFEFNESDEVGTKLDLARAYIDMGDSEGARGILDEVIHEGNEQQKHEAEVLMRSIT